jgi:hypothetical protein
MKKVTSILAVAVMVVAIATCFVVNTAVGIDFMNDVMLACGDCMIDFSEALACGDCMIDLSEALACGDCMIDGLSAQTQLS